MIIEDYAVTKNRHYYKIKSVWNNKDGYIINGTTANPNNAAWFGSYKWWNPFLGKWIKNIYEGFLSFPTDELLGKQIEKVILNVYCEELLTYIPENKVMINYGHNLISNPLHKDDDTKDWINLFFAKEFINNPDANGNFTIIELPKTIFPINGEAFDFKFTRPDVSYDGICAAYDSSQTLYPFLEVITYEPRKIIRLGMSELPDEDFPMPDEEIIGG